MKNILRHGANLRPELQVLIKTRAANLDTDMPWGIDFLDRLAPFAASGKLLRGGLVCFVYESFAGQPPTKPVTKAALALELTHSALLIHDDVMDNDGLRRGQPSLHRQYRQVGAEQGLIDSDQFGINMAICGGDAALFMAFELLAEVQAETLDIATGIIARQLFVKQLTRVCAGQMQDVYLDARPQLPSKSVIFSLMQAKTAAYTLALPLTMGAALANQKMAVIRQLEAIGIAAGIIFQIRDDELGVFGESATTGKPVGSDIREGKKTLLYYYLMKRSNTIDRRHLRQLFGKQTLTSDDIAFVQRQAQHYEVPLALAKDITQLTEQAESAVEALDANPSVKAELRELIAFCARRQF